MTPEQLKAVFAFERSVKPGDPVLVCWTSCGTTFCGKAKVLKTNAQSFRVELTETVAPDYHGGYPSGHELRVPRFALGSGGAAWTPNNRIEPTEGYKVPEKS